MRDSFSFIMSLSERPVVRLIAVEKGRSITVSSIGDIAMEQTIEAGKDRFMLSNSFPALLPVYMGGISRADLVRHAEKTDVEVSEGIRKSLLEVLKEQEIIQD
jgi:hypothetical protein